MCLYQVIMTLHFLMTSMTLNHHSINNYFISASLLSEPTCKLINRIPCKSRNSTSILKALPGKLDIKRHQYSLYLASLAMSKSVLKALPVKLNIKRHSPSIYYVLARLAIQQAFSKPCLVNLIAKDTHLGFSLSQQGSIFNKRSRNLVW